MASNAENVSISWCHHKLSFHNARRQGTRNLFNCGKTNSITYKYIYDESAHFIEFYTVDFGINVQSNLTEIIQVIGMGSVAARSRFC